MEETVTIVQIRGSFYNELEVPDVSYYVQRVYEALIYLAANQHEWWSDFGLDLDGLLIILSTSS